MNTHHNYSQFIVIALCCLLSAALMIACQSRQQIDDSAQQMNEPVVAAEDLQAEAVTAPETVTSVETATGAVTPTEADLDVQLRAIINELALTGDPSLGRDLPSIGDPVVQLGKKLFFTKALGGDKDSACVTCHVPTLGGGDGLSLPIGVGAVDPDLLGPGRTHSDGHPTVPRNAPTTFNIALWDQAIFHDGRIESLGKTAGVNGADGQGIRTPDVLFGDADPNAGANLTIAQSRFPLTSPEEMRGFDFEAGNGNDDVRNHLAQRIGGYGAGLGELASTEWLREFAVAFNHEATAERVVTEEYIAKAIGAYEQSQIFVDNAWKAYVTGDEAALSDAGKRGALLFFNSYNEGGANCAACHSGDFFTDEQYHVLAIPQIGPGKGDGSNGSDDFGRFRETGLFDDLYAFRTPTLLNVAVTGPWGHDGAYVTLAGIVRHHLNPGQAVATYDQSQLDPSVQTEHVAENTAKALAQLESNRLVGVLTVEDVALTNAQLGDLLAFLQALTDPCVVDEECLAPWMLDDYDVNPDGLLLEIAQAP